MMRVLHVASEVAPFAQSGGLADVVAGLPAALASHGLEVGVLVPLYRGVEARLGAAGHVLELGTPLAIELGPHRFTGSLRVARVGRVRYGFVDIPVLYDREGTMYGPGGPAEWTDNHLRFGALGKAALVAGPALLGGPPDVVHAHDWQGAAAAIFARVAGGRCAIIQTIHNLAFRGIYPKSAMADLGIPWSLFTTSQIEFWDQVCLLKGGIAAADVTTTVSPSYAREILTPERGEALDGFLRWEVKRLVGIVNGIDVQEWNPATDPALPVPFSAQALDERARGRDQLLAEFGLVAPPGEPLLGVIARMSDQKGLDLIAEVVPHLVQLGARMIVLGSGEPAIEDRFRWLGETFREHLAVHIGFDLPMSRRIYGGIDLFVMPSRFEPCGLGQLYAMRYGAIPIVHAVGGLRDTVMDPGDIDLARGLGTGIRFEPPTVEALYLAIRRGVALFRDPVTFAKLRRAAMARDSSWTASAHQYVQLYRSLRA